MLATPLVFLFGRGFFTGAWRQLRHRTANMDTLVALSTGITYLFSLFNLFFPEFWRSRGIEPHVYFEASGVVIAFVLLGRLLEERAKGGTMEAIRKLAGLRPDTVLRLDDAGHTSRSRSRRFVPTTVSWRVRATGSPSTALLRRVRPMSMRAC